MNHFIARRAWFITVDKNGDEDDWFGMPKFTYNYFGDNEFVQVDTEFEHELIVGDTYKFMIRGVNQSIESVDFSQEFSHICGKYTCISSEIFPDDTDKYQSGVRHSYSFVREFKGGVM